MTNGLSSASSSGTMAVGASARKLGEVSGAAGPALEKMEDSLPAAQTSRTANCIGTDAGRLYLA